MAYTISEDGVITMHKGDNAEFVVDLALLDETGADVGEAYEMHEGDVLTMTVRKRPSADFPIEFSVSSTNNVITIRPQDTANMAIGKYSADIQLSSGGKIMTVFPLLENLTDKQRSSTTSWNNFVLAGEVTVDEY